MDLLEPVLLLPPADLQLTEVDVNGEHGLVVS